MPIQKEPASPWYVGGNHWEKGRGEPMVWYIPRLPAEVVKHLWYSYVVYPGWHE